MELLRQPMEAVFAFVIDQPERNVKYRANVADCSDLEERHLELVGLVGIVHLQDVREPFPHLLAPRVCPEDPNNLVRVLRSVPDDVPDTLILQSLDEGLRSCIAVLVLARQTRALVVDIGLSDDLVGVLTLNMLENISGTDCSVARQDVDVVLHLLSQLSMYPVRRQLSNTIRGFVIVLILQNFKCPTPIVDLERLGDSLPCTASLLSRRPSYIGFGVPLTTSTVTDEADSGWAKVFDVV
jgi:hypothetical protein